MTQQKDVMKTLAMISHPAQNDLHSSLFIAILVQ